MGQAPTRDTFGSAWLDMDYKITTKSSHLRGCPSPGVILAAGDRLDDDAAAA